MYYGHTWRIEDTNADTNLFRIRGSVRQMCMESPVYFVLDVALGCWRPKIGDAGVDFQDGMLTRLDWKFTDAMILFVKTFDKTKF